MTCDHCGAPLRDDDTFCAHCGARMRRARVGSPTDPARFDRLLAHPGYPLARTHPPIPSSAGTLFASVVMIALALVLTLMNGYLLVTGDPGDGSILIFLPMVLLCLTFLGVHIHVFIETIRFHNAPIGHAIMVVVDERDELHGQRNPTRVHYATLAARDGQQRELPCDARVADRVAPGDIGVAFIKYDRLVGFTRFNE